MSVVVHDDMPVDKALKLLWREANRENIPKTLIKNRYRTKQADENHEQRKVWAKMKRRRRAETRKLARKGKIKKR